MPVDKYSIKRYKCFASLDVELNNITLLTGSNGTGKSSLIQGLLLARIAVERNSTNINADYLNISEWKDALVPLNDLYELQLGTVYQLFNLNDEGDSFEIDLSTEKFSFKLPEEHEANDVLRVGYSGIVNEGVVPFWKKKAFYYLNTERLGPRLNLDAHHTDFVHCGYKGELTGQVLFRHGITHKVLDARQHEHVKSQNLQQQVDAWLNQICAGAQGVIVKEHGVSSYQITMRTSAARQDVLAPNIGFGISYALPIIVEGLIAIPGCVLIVENPEAHLHPKGQSNMGYFLGLIAASGVKVIVETHSEHIVNGVRRASLSAKGLSSSEMSIYFFSINETGHISQKILQNENGDLDKFPVDFFDQVNQDMSTIFRLKSNR